MISKLKTFSRIYKDLGFKGILITIIKKVFPPNNPFFAWESRILFKYTPQSELKAQEITNNYSVIKLSNDETLELLGTNGMSEKSIQQSLKDDQHCWSIFDGNNVAGYVWISDLKEKIYSDTGYLFPLKKNEKAYWWRDLYITPTYRGKSLVQKLHLAWLNSLEHSIHDILFTEISPSNIASLKVHQKLGFTNFCYLRMWCLLGLRIYLLANKSKYSFSFRFSLQWFY